MISETLDGSAQLRGIIEGIECDHDVGGICKVSGQTIERPDLPTRPFEVAIPQAVVHDLPAPTRYVQRLEQWLDT